LNRSTFALFVAILIHLLILMLFWMLGTFTPAIQKIQKPKENKIKISLKEMPKKHKKSGLTKKQVPQPKIAPPMPKGSQLKKLTKQNTPKQKPVKYEPKKPPKKTKLNKPTKPKAKPKPKHEKIKPLPPKKPYIPLLAKKKDINKTKTKKTTAMSWLYEDQSSKEEKKEKQTQASGAQIGGSIRQMKELYGSKWGKLTPGQQKYMLDNQEIMRRITQQVLTRVASVNLSRDLHVNRINVVEFYLHPNGDMTDFKFLKKSGYYVLDETTKETIEYAYSRYPRPKEKILIRYNVYYNLARY